MERFRKKRMLAAILVCALLSPFLGFPVVASEPAVWSGDVASEYESGNGSIGDPYIITNGEQLALLAKQVSEYVITQGKYYRLANDIVLNDTSNWESWDEETSGLNGWTPIGKRLDTNEFNGVFDGKGHKIIGLYCVKPTSDDDPEQLSDKGLFGGIGPSGMVRNLGIEQSFVMGDWTVGSIAGTNRGIIINCYNKGTVHAAVGEAGGLVGMLASTSATEASIENSYNAGKVVADTEDCGGIAGIVFTDNIYDSGIEADKITPARITNCHNTANILGSGIAYGGIVGQILQSFNACSWANIANSPSVVIEGCYNTGEITGNSRLGGIVGDLTAYSKDAVLTMTECYNEGAIEGNADGNSDGFGGILGRGSTSGTVSISDCYSVGDFQFGQGDNGPVGGIAGLLGHNPEGESSLPFLTIKNCYYGGTIHKANTGVAVGGVLGLASGSSSAALKYSYYLKTEAINKDLPVCSASGATLTSCGYFADYNSNLIPAPGSTIAEEDKDNLITSLNNHRGESVMWGMADGRPTFADVLGPSIAPVEAVFDKTESSPNHKYIVVTLKNAADFTLLGIKHGETVLEEDIDYTVSGDEVTIRKEYLGTLEKGQVRLAFEFEDFDYDPVLTINIVETVMATSITLKVVTPQADDVTDKCNIVWFDDGEEVMSGAKLVTAEIGKEYTYEVSPKPGSDLKGLYGGTGAATSQEGEQTVTYELKEYDSIELTVKEGDADVTHECDVTWYTYKDHRYQVLSRTSELEYVYKAGDTYWYSIDFKDETMDTDYKRPVDTEVLAQKGKRDIEITLEGYETVDLVGTVILNGAREGDDVSKVRVSVSQTLNSGHYRESEIYPDEDGKFSVTVREAFTSVTLWYPDYQTLYRGISAESLNDAVEEYDMGNCMLDLLPSNNYYPLDVIYEGKRINSASYGLEYTLKYKDTGEDVTGFAVSGDTLCFC